MSKSLQTAVLRVQRPSSGRLVGRVRVPGSKSLSNRALLLGALGVPPHGTWQLHNVSDSDDSQVVRRFLQQTGFRLHVSGDHWTLQPPDQANRPSEPVHVDLQLAGTAMRFLTAVCCLLPGTFVLDGAPRLRERPLAGLLQALQAAGAAVESLGQPGFLPLRVSGNPDWQPSAFQINASASSQLLSALLLLAPRLPLGCRISLTGGVATPAYVDMTLGLLRQCGIVWAADAEGYTLTANRLITDRWTVESDWSGASYWLGMASLLPAELELPNLPLQALQGDAAQVALVQSWGLAVQAAAGGTLHVRQPKGRCAQLLTHDFAAMPDLAQTYAVVAATVPGRSHLSGLHTLPHKETDRIAALATELGKLGVASRATADTLTLDAPLALRQPATPIDTYHDHRMAMSFAQLACVLPHVDIAQPDVVAKSYPGFWDELAQLGFRLTPTPNS